MTNGELEVGMIVKTEKDEWGILFPNTDQSIDERLVIIYDNGWDEISVGIEEIYEPLHMGFISEFIADTEQFLKHNRDELKLLWDRKAHEISITVKINGKKAKLSDISDETKARASEIKFS